ncbi:MAG: RNA polymerase sigma factor RpoH [Gammaproteobacteria bacterium]
MSNFMNLQPALPAGSLDSYIRSINQVPLLSADEERSLAVRYQEHNDLGAARSLVLPHLRFVVRVARGYSGYGLAQADLIQEGNIGLMKAVKRFDPNRGVRLVSFAVHWIRAEIHEYILRNWRIVKVATTKAQRKLFFNLRSAKKRLAWLNREEVDVIAEDLGVSAKDVLEMEKRMGAHDMPFDGAVSDSSENETLTPSAYLETSYPGPEEIVDTTQQTDNNQQRLQNALATLDERSRDIMTKRWLAEKKTTLHDLAKYYNISAERIRQLEQCAIKKLQHTLAT